jgi:flagellar assembly protein FliH
MTVTAKYHFEDFSASAKNGQAAEPVVGLTQHQAEMLASEEAGFLRGLAEGRLQAEEDETARLAASMQRLSINFAEASERFSAIASEAEAQAARLAVVMAKKLAGALLQRHPLGEIEAVARSVFGHLRATPHAVVRVHDSLVDAVRPRLDRIAKEAGFTGTIVVLGEPDTRIGDARVEWADGGAGRDSAALERVIDEVVRRYVGAGTQETRP